MLALPFRPTTPGLGPGSRTAVTSVRQTLRLCHPFPMRVLVVEDDRRVASFVQRGLEQEGFAVDVLYDGHDAGAHAATVDYDCVVLDLMLPGRSGLQVLRDIRARKSTLPVLVLTAKNAPEERVVGLDGGADDYMGKPFSLAELTARIRALMRRGKTVE